MEVVEEPTFEPTLVVCEHCLSVIPLGEVEEIYIRTDLIRGEYTAYLCTDCAKAGEV